MLIAQISDFHLCTPDRPVHGRVDSAAALRRAVAHLNALRTPPDVVLATGDLAAEGRTEEYTLLAELLAPLKVPLYAIPGNHDDRALMRARLGGQGYFPAHGEFLHYVVEGHPLRLICLDTVIPGQDGGELCPARLAWLRARLDEAPRRPTLIAMHHPPIPLGVPASDSSNCRGGAALADLLGRCANVVAVVCGHVHRPSHSRWAGTVLCTAPSIAYQFPLEMQAERFSHYLPEPSSFLLHLWLQAERLLVSHTVYVGDPGGLQPL